jgi:ubiquinone/menaquinone biosynthesis C-methylase UbiE
MKDLIVNRKRLDLTQKLGMLRVAVRENGLAWTFNLGLYYAASFLAESAFARMHHLRRKHGLPGLNSLELNRRTWEGWDWSGRGEEWTHSEEWKKSLIDNVLLKYVPAGGHILEIGPGAGRWTETLQQLAERLTGVDISQKCVDICREKFAHCSNAQFMTNTGCDLTGIGDQSVDSIWSFDVFVHINRREVEQYAREFRRVLKPGGRAVIHHGKTGGAHGGWRSDLTVEALGDILAAAGLQIVAQFSEWRDNGGEFKVGLYDDAVTVIEKPFASDS